MFIRRNMGSTNQADPSYSTLMKQFCFYLLCPLGFLQVFTSLIYFAGGHKGAFTNYIDRDMTVLGYQRYADFQLFIAVKEFTHILSQLGVVKSFLST